MSRSPRRLPGAAVAAFVLMGTACGTGTSTAKGCGPILRETLDPAYLVHVVGADTDVEYRSDPPTSGPHQPAPAQTGAVAEPLSRPVQVGVLERGDVLVQYRPDLDSDQIETLRALAGEQVVVAPNPDLPEPIVLTAWVFKRSCGAVDEAAIAAFIEERAGQGPDAAP